MPKCPACDQETSASDGCAATQLRYQPDAPGLPEEQYARIPYGSETATDRATLLRCPHCNAKLGLIHHSGCPLEECPRRHHPQLLTCACNDSGGFTDIIPDPRRDGGTR